MDVIECTIIGSDVHFTSEIGSVNVRVEELTIQLEKILCAQYSSSSAITRRRIIGLLKQREWSMLFSSNAAYLK